MTEAVRPRTPVDTIADEYVDRLVELSPITATYLGRPGHDTELDDFSPDGLAAQSELRRETLARLEGVAPADDVDVVTLSAMRERLGLSEEMYAAGLDEMSLNVIASPMQSIREIVDLMPTDTAEDWEAVAARISRMPVALDQWHASLAVAAERGQVAARRQVVECAAQAERFAADGGYFADLLASARVGDAPLTGGTADRLADAVGAARAAYAGTARRLRDELLSRAPESDAVGRDLYALCSRYFIGATVDLEETYAWGIAELERITAQAREVAAGISGSGIVDDAVAQLDADPAYRLVGTDALRRWMQERADAAIDALAGVHFDIAEPLRRIECRIAPTSEGGIYYTGPTSDFSRPGRMWWAVPPDVEEFGTWRELTTVYHEGVPGHHLQVAQAVYRSDILNTWRRQLAWTSGHGEGWALYAERLMEELGFMDDPGDRLGLLDSQSLRAARVVIDIGLHCGFEAPASVGGGAWDYDKAWSLLTSSAHLAEGFLRFELSRYLGWPGQAPSYKVGERLWLDLREEVRRRDGASFSLKDFHARALDLGGLDLDTLRASVLG